LINDSDKQLLENVVAQANALGYRDADGNPYTGIAYLEEMSGR
jgi:hypothetical protein